MGFKNKAVLTTVLFLFIMFSTSFSHSLSKIESNPTERESISDTTIPEPEDIKVLVNFAANVSQYINKTSASIFLDMLENETGFDLTVWENETVFRTSFTSIDLQFYDVFILFVHSNLTFTENAINALKDFVKEGKTLMICHAPESTNTTTNINNVIQYFGFKFLENVTVIDPVNFEDTNTSIIAPFFLDQIPQTHVLNQENAFLIYRGIPIITNSSLINSTKLEVVDHYNLTWANVTAFADKNNNSVKDSGDINGTDVVLGVCAETENQGRFIGIGSVAMFNNTYTNATGNFSAYENLMFANETIKWLAKLTGLVLYEDMTTDKEKITYGEQVNVSVIIEDENMEEIVAINASIIVHKIATMNITMLNISRTGKQFHAAYNSTTFEEAGTVEFSANSSKVRGYTNITTYPWIIVDVFPKETPRTSLNSTALILITMATIVTLAGLGAYAFRIARLKKREK
ncbi:MAG: hypothetical protein ACFE68_03020 [Candidatus Hodarchaeota archaeon]